jgi:hypothetical protein
MSILFQENYIKRRFLFWNYLQSFRIPTDMFTVMFAIGRLPGWIAQWKEMRKQRTNRKTKTDLYWTPLRDLKHPTDKFTLKASLFCEAFFIFVKSYYM